MELRAIQKRNRDETIRARNAGEPKQCPSYGYMYVRLAPMAKIDHVALDPIGAEIIREVARRILADQTEKITIGTEAVRLTREGIPSPGDRRAQLYGRPMKGGPWTGHTLKHILCSEAALGYLMHGKRPVLGADGRPMRIAEPLWDRATHDALVKATAPKRDGHRAPKGMRPLTGTFFCGNCGSRPHVTGRGNNRYAYECTARIRGIRTSAQCKPAPAIAITAADALVSEWFLARYGPGEVLRKIYDPGTGHAAQIAELEATRTRLREDRQAGLYDDADDAEWFRTEYRRLGEEIAALNALPERKPGMHLAPTGRTIAQERDAADNARRREMLAEFEVRVVLHPTGREPRVAITGMEVSPDDFTIGPCIGQSWNCCPESLCISAHDLEPLIGSTAPRACRSRYCHPIQAPDRPIAKGNRSMPTSDLRMALVRDGYYSMPDQLAVIMSYVRFNDQLDDARENILSQLRRIFSFIYISCGTARLQTAP